MPSAVPMFPLSSVLLPGMPLPLRLFEDRYLTMLEVVMDREPADFGVVLIERGTEAGGGETRFDVGTMARIAPDEGTVVMIAQGTHRFAVERWLPDDPYPQAEIHALPDLEWTGDLDASLIVAEDAVRSHLARAAVLADQGLVDLRWAPDTPLADDPVERCWQLAGISLMGELDQLAALRSTEAGELLDLTVESSAATLEALEFTYGQD